MSAEIKLVKKGIIMAAYFNRNLRLLKKAIEKKNHRVISHDFLAVKSGFPSIKLQGWEREGEPTLLELRKLADFYSTILEIDLTVDQLYNRDLRYDDRFKELAWNMM